MAKAALADLAHTMSPMPATGPAVELIASATLTQSLQTGASAVVSVADARRVGLWLKHDAHASESGGYVVLQVLVSAARTAPAIGDDSWYAPSFADATATEADIAGGVTLVTGADYTRGPEWRSVECGPLLLTTQAHGNSEKSRTLFPSLDVTMARWMYCAMIQQGDTTNFGTGAVSYNLAL